MLLITGAAGFIGSAFTWALNERGRNDLVLSDLFGAGEKWKNLLGCRFNRFVNRNRLFEELASEPWAKSIEAVVHMGARTDTTETDTDFLFRINTEYTARLCRWALDGGIRFIYASSAAVYGDGSLGFSDDDTLTPRLRPLNPYGFSKWLFDMRVLDGGLVDRVTGLRFFNVYGPNEYHKGTMASVIHRAFPLARREGKVRLFESHRADYGHGEQRRDFVYVKDVLNVVLFLLDHPEVNGIFNLGSGRAHTFNDLARALLKTLQKEERIEYFPMPDSVRSHYQYFTEADISRLRKAGYAGTFTPFEEAVEDYVRNYLVPGKYLPQ